MRDSANRHFQQGEGTSVSKYCVSLRFVGTFSVGAAAAGRGHHGRLPVHGLVHPGDQPRHVHLARAVLGHRVRGGAGGGTRGAGSRGS